MDGRRLTGVSLVVWRWDVDMTSALDRSRHPIVDRRLQKHNPDRDNKSVQRIDEPRVMYDSGRLEGARESRAREAKPGR